MATWSIETAAGTEYELSVSNGIAFRGAIGHRMAPVQNISTNYALTDGALYQRTAVRPRVLTLLIDAIGTSEATLVALENTLVTHTNPHRSVLPVQIWYRSGAAGTGMYVNAYYEGGLEGRVPNGFVTDSIPMRFYCPDPYWLYETPITAQALDVYDSMVTPNRIIGRIPGVGTWDNLDAGADGTILCLAAASNGDIYAGGSFANIGGVACANIAMWDASATNWVAMGAGCDNTVYALTITANGDLYVGGAFSNAGGAAALRIAKWVSSTTTWSAVGAGLDGSVYTLLAANNGDVYVGGAFLNVAGGGIAVAYIARWTAAGAWAALGAGVNNTVSSLAQAINGEIYVGGTFTTAGGAGANYVASWDGTSWAALGAGTDNHVRAIAVASNGDLYAGGDFTTAGGISANYIAKWNGVSWSTLSSGLSDIVRKITISDTGDVYVAGSFGTAGGIVATKWAIWSSSTWLPGLATVDGALYDIYVESGSVILAGSFTTATTPGVTTITTTCTARAYPVIAITGPGRLLYLINYTTNQVIYFDITLVASEVLTIDLRERIKTVTSSFRGNLISGVLAGSLTNFYLQPGTNYIGCYVDNASATAVYGYTPRYWGAA